MYSILPDNLNQIMENWIKQPGFPLLTVTVDNGEVTISQVCSSAFLSWAVRYYEFYFPLMGGK